MATDISKINETAKWQDLTEGMSITGAGTSKQFNTGEWRTDTPVYIESNCRQCLICTPVCPDSSIPVENGKRGAFDLEHCKGCGICVKACPFGAIVMEGGK
jgi:pyruvate ferredoxin oxidoreductase delta subunit